MAGQVAISIDIGHGYTKSVARQINGGAARNRIIIIPSAVSPAQQARKGKVLGMRSYQPDQVSFEYEGKMYTYNIGVGEHLLSPDDRMKFTPPVIALILGTIALQGCRTGDSVWAILGVPIGYLPQIRIPKIPSSFKFRGNEITIDLHYRITGQTVGSVLMAQDLLGQKSKGTMLVVDIGYGTTDMVVLRGGQIDLQSVASLPMGAVDALGSPNKEDADRVVNRIKNIVLLALRRDQPEVVIFTGGGATLWGESLTKAIMPLVGERTKIIVMDNAQMANAQGLLRLAEREARKALNI